MARKVRADVGAPDQQQGEQHPLRPVRQISATARARATPAPARAHRPGRPTRAPPLRGAKMIQANAINHHTSAVSRTTCRPSGTPSHTTPPAAASRNEHDIRGARGTLRCARRNADHSQAPAKHQRRHDDHGRHGRQPQQHPEEQHDEHHRGDDPLAQGFGHDVRRPPIGAATCSPVRPKRRWRPLKNARAASRSATENSGQSRSVKNSSA